ncbi:hypothetical protein [Sinorhizobium saheli]|uniref:hypothetical protein n=1 Tax=Sinorhizobium saheli TaxID=36856 RepID=UPI001295A755|nr:hypothetical protein [Sinorhizobium saheli]MQW85976.1 hypothetical protein [Sinorhizobium saheli]
MNIALNTETNLAILANLAAILTAVIAVWAYGQYRWERWRKRVRLENYLRDERGIGHGEGHTILDLVAHLGMSEAEIADAAFRSKVIRRRVTVDSSGRPDRLVLVHETGDLDEDFPVRPGRARF